MIVIDFFLAVAACAVLSIVSAVFAWLFLRPHKQKDLFLEPRYIWHCSVCTYSYINTKEDTISVCPRCSSYNKK
jgi:rubrerythrin